MLLPLLDPAGMIKFSWRRRGAGCQDRRCLLPTDTTDVIRAALRSTGGIRVLLTRLVGTKLVIHHDINVGCLIATFTCITGLNLPAGGAHPSWGSEIWRTIFWATFVAGTLDILCATVTLSL
jgi:hypothetical protein